jgi:hypothetical protein
LVENFHKELVLKANIQDIAAILDNKVNVGDINQTLSLVQAEVERCVREDDLKKALNE